MWPGKSGGHWPLFFKLFSVRLRVYPTLLLVVVCCFSFSSKWNWREWVEVGLKDEDVEVEVGLDEDVEGGKYAGQTTPTLVPWNWVSSYKRKHLIKIILNKIEGHIYLPVRATLILSAVSVVDKEMNAKFWLSSKSTWMTHPPQTGLNSFWEFCVDSQRGEVSLIILEKRATLDPPLVVSNCNAMSWR